MPLKNSAKPAKASSHPNEVFTPAPVVRHMSSLCEPLLSDPARKVFEPGCGTGNFLIEALSRRLENITSPVTALLALSNLYGVDINPDYLAIARHRLKNTILDRLSAQSLDYRFLPLVDLFLNSNLIQADLIRSRDTITFIDWQPLSDYNFHAVPTKLSDTLPKTLPATSTTFKTLEGTNV